MPVAAAYFLPVSVFVAVTATPGRGTPPALPAVPAMTVPRIVPPCCAADAGGAGVCEEAADEVAGSALCVVGTDGALCIVAGGGAGVWAPDGNRPAMHTTTHTIALARRALNL